MELSSGVWLSVGSCMAPRSASSTAGWVKTRGELALRNVREPRQLGLEELQREQDMPRGGAPVGSHVTLKARAPLIHVDVEVRLLRKGLWLAA